MYKQCGSNVFFMLNFQTIEMDKNYAQRLSEIVDSKEDEVKTQIFFKGKGF